MKEMEEFEAKRKTLLLERGRLFWLKISGDRLMLKTFQEMWLETGHVVNQRRKEELRKLKIDHMKQEKELTKCKKDLKNTNEALDALTQKSEGQAKVFIGY